MAISPDEKARIEALSLSEIREKIKEVNALVIDCSKDVRYLELQNPRLKPYYQQVAIYLALKEKLDTITDDRDKLDFKQKNLFDIREQQYDTLRSDTALCDEIQAYSGVLSKEADAKEMQNFVASRLNHLEKKRKKQRMAIKTLAIIGAVALAVGFFVNSLSKANEEKSKKVKAEQVEKVRKSEQRTINQTDPCGLSKEKLKAFVERISKYPKKTQQAMCDGIEYLQWLNKLEFEQAKDNKNKNWPKIDLAKSHLTRLELNMRDNDPLVLSAVLNIKKEYLRQAKEKPGTEFNLAPALSAIPDGYDIALLQQKKEMQARQGK